MMEVLVRGNKIDVTDAMKDYVKARKDGVDYETIVNGLKKYLMYYQML